MRLSWSGRTVPAAYERSKDVVAARHGDRTVLMSLRREQYFALDAVGGRIWELLERPGTIAGIARTIAAEYDAPEETIRADVSELLDEMMRDRLVRAT